MVIDSHVHIFTDAIAEKAITRLAGICHMPYYTNGTLSDTREKMEQWGVDAILALNIATKPKQQKTINEWASGVQDHKSVFCLGTIHPDAPDAAAELERFASLKLCGLKLHPDYQGFQIDEERLFPVYDAASQLGIPIVFHTGWDPLSPDFVHAPPALVAKVAKLFPKLTIIAAHLGGMKRYEESEEYLTDLDNVYLDTAMCAQFCPLEQFKRIASKKGAEHILFGSDCPWSSSALELEYLERASLPSRDLDLIHSQNAVRIFKLSL